MFTQSFHNHTWRCNHATGTEREYIENAVQHDMTMLGFTYFGAASADAAPSAVQSSPESGSRPES